MPFYHLPHPYNPGYAIPDYVLAEPPGRGTFTTAWLPRGTISQIVPDFLAKPGKKLLGRDNAGLGGLGSLGDTVLDGSSLDEHTLATPTLSGDTLGARKYTLESLGSSKMYAPVGDDLSILANPWTWIFGGVAYLWWKDRKRAQAQARTRAYYKSIDDSLEDMSRQLRAQGATVTRNPARRRRARRARRSRR